MTQINQQRKVSSCCGAEVEQTECFCPGSTDLKHDQLICKKCEKRCDSKPQDHIVEADKIVAELPVERTSEETRQTGSEWEMKLEKFYTIGYSFSTKNSMCLSCRDSVDETHYCPKPTKERPSFETIRNFIRDLLAAQKEEMESKNRQDKPTLHVPSETISMEDHNKRIIEAVEKTEGIVKELSQSFFDLTNRHFPDDMSVNIKVVNAKELLGKLADFKREYGGKE